MLLDPLANALSAIKNAEKAKHSELTIRPISKLIENVLSILKKNGYIKDFKISKDIRGGSAQIQLSGAINNIGVIKPRFPVSVDTLEKYEKRYLPAKDFGFLILSTSKGLMTHSEAKEKRIGGVLIAYVY